MWFNGGLTVVEILEFDVIYNTAPHRGVKRARKSSGKLKQRQSMGEPQMT
jgi:hypothetical protein